jgi:hypothetical protein
MQEPIMQEPVIQWGAIALFGSILFGWVAINLLMQWQERKRRRLARGFRNMKSVAHRQRERARRVKWGDPAPNRNVAGRAPGWR